MQLLNPPLHRQLTAACKQGLYRGNGNGLPGGDVKIANHGQPAIGAYERNPIATAQKGNEWRLNLSGFGETYCVCCPGCGDTRHRLWLSHRWGVYDHTTKSRHTYLWNCFNEGCTKNKGFLKDFMRRIDITSTMAPIAGLKVPDVTSLPKIQDVPHTVSPPGVITPLTALGKDHLCIEFLKARGMSPRALDKYFSVGFVEHSNNPAAVHRMYVPIKQGGELRGWQARYIGDGSGDCKDLYVCQNYLCGQIWKSEEKPVVCPACSYSGSRPRKVVKWYTGPGTKTGQCMLNYDYAKPWDFIVVMEGPMDVFNLGTPTRTQVSGPGVCIFGKTITQYHMQMLEPWRQRGTVYVVLDDDVWDNTVKQCNARGAYFPGGLVPVPLFSDADPGDIEHKVLWERIREAGQLANATAIPRADI